MNLKAIFGIFIVGLFVIGSLGAMAPVSEQGDQHAPLAAPGSRSVVYGYNYIFIQNATNQGDWGGYAYELLKEHFLTELILVNDTDFANDTYEGIVISGNAEFAEAQKNILYYQHNQSVPIVFLSGNSTDAKIKAIMGVSGGMTDSINTYDGMAYSNVLPYYRRHMRGILTHDNSSLFTDNSIPNATLPINSMSWHYASVTGETIAWDLNGGLRDNNSKVNTENQLHFTSSTCRANNSINSGDFATAGDMGSSTTIVPVMTLSSNWIWIDMEEAHTINTIYWSGSHSNFMLSTYSPCNFTIKYSSDNSSWTVLTQRNDTSDSHWTYHFDAVDCRYINITNISTWQAYTGTMGAGLSVPSIEAYNIPTAEEPAIIKNKQTYSFIFDLPKTLVNILNGALVYSGGYPNTKTVCFTNESSGMVPVVDMYLEMIIDALNYTDNYGAFGAVPHGGRAGYIHTYDTDGNGQVFVQDYIDKCADNDTALTVYMYDPPQYNYSTFTNIDNVEFGSHPNFGNASQSYKTLYDDFTALGFDIRGVRTHGLHWMNAPKNVSSIQLCEKVIYQSNLMHANGDGGGFSYAIMSAPFGFGARIPHLLVNTTTGAYSDIYELPLLNQENFQNGIYRRNINISKQYNAVGTHLIHGHGISDGDLDQALANVTSDGNLTYNITAFDYVKSFDAIKNNVSLSLQSNRIIIDLSGTGDAFIAFSPPAQYDSWGVDQIRVYDNTTGAQVAWTEGSICFDAEAGHEYIIYLAAADDTDDPADDSIVLNTPPMVGSTGATGTTSTDDDSTATTVSNALLVFGLLIVALVGYAVVSMKKRRRW